MQPDAQPPILEDVLIIGGGHAGLSAALTLYRALHTCVIFNSSPPRNSYGTLTHLTPGFENRQPQEIFAKNRAELSLSGLVKFVDDKAERIERREDGSFGVIDARGASWLGRKLLLAYGVQDVFPDLEGYRENYAKGIFYCMFCFGYEYRGQPSAGLLATGILSHSMHAIKNAEDAQKFVDSVTIYTDTNHKLKAEIESLLETSSIKVDDRKIKRLGKSEKELAEMEIYFEDGSVVSEAFVVHKPSMVLDEKLIENLGRERIPSGEIKTTFPFNATNVPGVYAAGDCASVLKQIPNAVTMGSYAGCGIARELPRHVTNK